MVLSLSLLEEWWNGDKYRPLSARTIKRQTGTHYILYARNNK